MNAVDFEAPLPSRTPERTPRPCDGELAVDLSTRYRKRRSEKPQTDRITPYDFSGAGPNEGTLFPRFADYTLMWFPWTPFIGIDPPKPRNCSRRLADFRELIPKSAALPRQVATSSFKSALHTAPGRSTGVSSRLSESACRQKSSQTYKCSALDLRRWRWGKCFRRRRTTPRCPTLKSVETTPSRALAPSLLVACKCADVTMVRLGMSCKFLSTASA